MNLLPIFHKVPHICIFPLAHLPPSLFGLNCVSSVRQTKYPLWRRGMYNRRGGKCARENRKEGLISQTRTVVKNKVIVSLYHYIPKKKKSGLSYSLTVYIFKQNPISNMHRKCFKKYTCYYKAVQCSLLKVT